MYFVCRRKCMHTAHTFNSNSNSTASHCRSRFMHTLFSLSTGPVFSRCCCCSICMKYFFLAAAFVFCWWSVVRVLIVYRPFRPCILSEGKRIVWIFLRVGKLHSSSIETIYPYSHSHRKKDSGVRRFFAEKWESHTRTQYNARVNINSFTLSLAHSHSQCCCTIKTIFSTGEQAVWNKIWFVVVVVYKC